MKNKIIELAKKQTGNDYTIYCRDMGYNYRIEWCACFISWLAEKLDIIDIIPVDMSCNSQIAKFKKMGVWHTDKNFQSGDILYYDWDNSGDADHVGIIEKSENGFLSVIEGNSGIYPDDRVRYREISSGSPLIFGYARPDYNKFTESVSVILPVLKKGSYGNAVKSLQILLDSKGFNLGAYGIDGDFGSDTEYAVKQFQKKYSIDIDGIAGKDTWTNLLT